MKKFTPICIQFLLITSAGAQCVSTAFTNATSFSTDNSTGVYDFTSPGNAQSSNNARASAGSLISVLSGTTYYLKATGFNFNLPSYSTICGVTVEVECRATGLLLTAAVRDNEIRILKNGVITGNNYALPGDWGTADTYRSYGGAADLWGTTLTPADVNDPGFGIVFSARIIALIAALPSADIDHIRMKIDYNTLLPVHLEYFKSVVKKNSIHLEWKTTGEEDNATIVLQRSFNGSQWSAIAKYKLSSAATTKIYTYKDAPVENGQYAYRLKLVSASGVITWSDIKQAGINDVVTFSVYPNPSRNVIELYPVKLTEKFFITDIYGRPWTLPAEEAGPNRCRITIQFLPGGVYLVKNGNHSLRFIKD